MAVARKKASRRSGASRGAAQGSGLRWFVTGLVVGFGAAAVLFFSGFMPGKPEPQPVADNSTTAAEIEPVATGDDEIAAAPDGNRYDFFTVLPEMEVVVPEQQLDQEVRNQPEASVDTVRYLLQAGSFRTAAEAEQRKASLAMLGNAASVQRVDINGEAWHRVRIGPVDGARRADEIRRQLQDNGIETLVMRAP